MYTLIRATSLTLQTLLRLRFGAEPAIAAFFGGQMVISLNNPEEMTTNGLQGVSLWLYRVVRDEDRLNQPPRRLGPDRYQPPPLPLRLHYLVTPLVTINQANAAFSPEREQLLLGKILEVFHDTPLLRGTDLQDDLTGAPMEIGVRLETLGLEDLTRVWEGLHRPYQLSLSYQVTVVEIASQRQPHDTLPVRMVVPEYGVVTAVSDT